MGRGESKLKRHERHVKQKQKEPSRGELVAAESEKFKGVTSSIKRKLMIQRSDFYRGDANIKFDAFNAINIPNGYELVSVDTILFRGNPDRSGFVDAEAKFTLRKKASMGDKTLFGGLRTGKTKSDNWQAIRIKVFE